MTRSLGDVARARRHDVDSSADLARLADRLGGFLAHVQSRPLYVPDAKALLSQDGGVCAIDGARLVFDPLSAQQHVCEVCGATYSGTRHHRAWVWRYHLWLSERAIHGALLVALDRADTRVRDWSLSVLKTYAARYRTYPNQDNVLGPSRLFFSTYLESIWLVQVVVATMLLSAQSATISDRLVRSLQDMVVESSDLIGSFDEGISNRQVWNATAVLASGIFLDDERRVERGLSMVNGIESLLQNGVAENGRWHEGENYHLFALHGFLLAAEFASTVGENLYEIHPRLGRMYSAPLATMFPNLTLAARGDSPFGVSVRQPRFAELWEIGYARSGEEQLVDLLGQIYDGTGSQLEIGLAEIAEVEQNRPAMKIRRSDLGWKALLWMLCDLPATKLGAQRQPRTDLIKPNGPVILRTSDGRYVGLECAGTGTGHGHPDRLHLSLFDREPVLVDFGTGSYVNPSLHWYRSWLSHNVPEKKAGDGRTGTASCIAVDTSGHWQWCRASLRDFAGPESNIQRNVIVGSEYVIDIVDVTVAPAVVVDLPLHLLGYDVASQVEPAAHGVEHEVGYDALDVRGVISGGRRFSSGVSGRGDVFVPARTGETVFVAAAPGPPPLTFGHAEPHLFLLRRCGGPGRWVHVFARVPQSVLDVEVEDHVVSIVSDGARDTIRVSAAGVEIEAAGATVRLAGSLPSEGEGRHVSRTTSTRGTRSTGTSREVPCPVLRREPTDDDVERMLSAGHVLDGRFYRRSERPYPGADRFSVRWCMFAVAGRVSWVVDVRKVDLMFRPRDAPDPQLDNEFPDIHSDGIQIYYGDVCNPTDVPGQWRETWRGFLLVPDETERAGVRVHAVRGLPARDHGLTANVATTPRGYRAVLSTVIDAPRRGAGIPFDLVVNEMYAGRERRAGQLALSGGGWVYLRGDRESPDTAFVGIFS